MLHRRRCTGIKRLKSSAVPNGQSWGLSPNPSYLGPPLRHAAYQSSHNLPKSFIVGGAQGPPGRSAAPGTANQTGRALPQILHSCDHGDEFSRPSNSHNPPKSFIVTPVRHQGRRSSLLLSMTYRPPWGRGRFPKSFIVSAVPVFRQLRCPDAPPFQPLFRLGAGEGHSGFPKSFIVGGCSPCRQAHLLHLSHFSYFANRVSVLVADLTRTSPNPS